MQNPLIAKSSFYPVFWLLVCLLILLLSSCMARQLEQGLELPRVAQEIHRLTNELRSSKGLAPLLPLKELEDLSRIHSLNMASQKFFDHRDPEGNQPQDRLRKFLPGLLCSSSGENIALRSHDGEDETRFAQILMQMWQDSPEHYAHLVSPDFRHLGVGLAADEDRIYATQTFANGVALLQGKLPETVSLNQTLPLNFRFLADFPSAELSIFFYAPDPQARIPAGNGSFYIGKGPLSPQWQDAEHFSVNILTQYGAGSYRLRLGHKQAYYEQEFAFEALIR